MLHDFSLHNHFMGSARFLPLQVAAVCYRRRSASFDFLFVPLENPDLCEKMGIMLFLRSLS